jgi:transcriptional regulator with XRE-family HTH domain
MSIIVDDPGPVLAKRLQKERDQRGWSLADLAARSDVSKATLSKIEREEVSPTASVLSRIATAFGITLAELLTHEQAASHRLLRHDEQPTWRDPETSYTRRQVFLSQANPLELVEVNLPRGKSLSFPPSAYENAKHVVWVLSGHLTIIEGRGQHDLDEGDRLEFGPPEKITYRNTTKSSCRYLVALLRT